jgi:hypothetical protein
MVNSIIGIPYKRYSSYTFVHFYSYLFKDSTVRPIRSVINDVMDQIQCIHGASVKFHMWSDNAGCYKSTEMLAHLFHSGIVKSYNFCESRNGKGPCDRTAATIKSAIRWFTIRQSRTWGTHSLLKDTGKYYCHLPREMIYWVCLPEVKS